ncbi:unnamed protein product [Ceutorhynchus assimilis]|uniref:Uncharacterized protein n=1 Tax=Ceutorhynchus assimilis TaxID=467358 RepID=A0A9N9MQ96_9CUCU|nr:unnamed protein product [Ceutorhynchus assimilis]
MAEPFKRDFVEFEKAFRELKTELHMKRSEVTKLKSELEDAHNEIHNYKQSLDKEKKSSEDNKITMAMFMKRTQDYESKFFEKRDALARLDLQHKMECSKNTELTEDLRKIAFEKLQLVRKIVALEEQRKRDMLYTNDITQHCMQVKNMMETLQSDIGKVNEDHETLHCLIQQVDSMQESAQTCQGLSDSIAILKSEMKTFEEESVKYKAKSELLESLISDNVGLQDQENLEAKVILNQYKKMIAHNKQIIEIKNEMIKTLNSNLNQEKKINIKLILDNDRMNEQILNLQKKSNELRAKIGETIQIAEPTQPVQNTLLEASVARIKIESDIIIEIEDSPRHV